MEDDIAKVLFVVAERGTAAQRVIERIADATEDEEFTRRPETSQWQNDETYGCIAKRVHVIRRQGHDVSVRHLTIMSGQPDTPSHRTFHLRDHTRSPYLFCAKDRTVTQGLDDSEVDCVVHAVLCTLWGDKNANLVSRRIPSSCPPIADHALEDGGIG